MTTGDLIDALSEADIEGVDAQVIRAGAEYAEGKFAQHKWLWYDDNAMCLSFGRWRSEPEQAPYVRLDLALKAIHEKASAHAREAGAQEPVAAYEFGRSNGDGTFSVHIERSLPAQVHPEWPVTKFYTHPAPAQEPVAVPAGIDPERACRAAEAANHRFGQWMPQRWLDLFIRAYNDGSAK